MLFRLIMTFVCLCMTSISYGMDTIFIRPTLVMQKARFATPNLTTFSFQTAYSKADESYNACEQTVPLLSFYGAEDLLKRFIDPKLPYNDSSKVGQALFEGKLKAIECDFIFEKNFQDGIFFTFQGGTTNYIFSNIKPIPVSSKGRILTEYEIEQDTELKDYLTIFENTFLKDQCEFAIKQIGPLSFTLGYAKNFQHFEHADFLDISIQTGLWVPSQNIDPPNSSIPQTFLPPTNSKVSFGIPVQASIEVGFYEWLNIGGTGLIIPFISNDVIMRLNPSATNNILLSNDNVLTKVRHKPMVYTNIYLAAEELLPKTYFAVGCSYVKQFGTTYATCDSHKYPLDIINNYSLHEPWERLCINLEAAVNFATTEQLSLPSIKFAYVFPVYGKSVYKTSLVGGELKLEISGQF